MSFKLGSSTYRSMLMVFVVFSFIVTQPIRAEDAGLFEKIIGEQIDAFQKNDSVTAFGFAAETIQQHFKNADSFMRMVKFKYDPVYRPRWYKFDQFIMLEDVPTQSVIIQSIEGVYWLAIYEFELHVDKSWKIRGVSLSELVGAGA